MKKIFVTMLLSASLGAMAQSPNVDYDIDKRAENFTEKVAKELDLNATQKARLLEIHTAELEEMTRAKKARRDVVVQHREEIKDKREELKNDQEALEARRAALKAEKEAYAQEKQAMEEKYRSQVKSILTEEQFEQYLLLKGRKQGKAEAINKMHRKMEHPRK
ncbi:DUF4890 domain-containing protein [Luteibaculum oceani]|uniref:DUF4890 domain-containing protein n=1 Tax=Luteibaculum oceani TaxID=1294296 RepID=A0A5C6V0B7_9FLAO|nr:DUF4890 domain-containing protein [Luteibaculum oceani]TXC78609.1 DUF4890 domain-containing protein [Luteibaculum oceani]